MRGFIALLFFAFAMGAAGHATDRADGSWQVGRYQSSLSLSVERGKLNNFEWRAVEPGGQACTVEASAQAPLRGGLRFVAGDCRVTLRDLGEFVALSAANCAALCAPEAYLEPLLFDRRGKCELLRHAARSK